MKPMMFAIFAPISINNEVKPIEIHNKSISEALTGDNIDFNIRVIEVYHVKKDYNISNKKYDILSAVESFDFSKMICHQLPW
jgi:translation elongation factor EF-1alpha